MECSIFKYCILFVFCYLGNCQKTPSITFITRTQTVRDGGNVHLDCAVENAQGLPVSWYKYSDRTESTLLTTNTKRIVADPKISVHYLDDLSAYQLGINEIQIDDAGVYQCVIALTDNSKISADVELQVRRPPIIFDNSTRSIIGTEGESVQLECFADGFPSPKIFWHRNNKEILPTGGSIFYGNILSIDALKKEYFGTYFCVAENGQGKSARREITLEILFAPVVTVPKERVEQALKQEANLACHIEAFPPPVITWHKNDEQLSYNDTNYRISNFATENNAIETILHFRKTDKKDYGLFTCKAKNKIGEDQGTVEFFVKSKNPTITFINQTQTESVGGYVQLDCVVENEQELPVSWYKYNSDKTESILLTTKTERIVADPRISVGYIDDLSTYQLKINKIEVNDAGVYQCVIELADNSKISADVKLQVRKPPVIFDNSTRSIVVSEGESVQLECYADGFPTPQIAWHRINEEILPTGGSIFYGNILSIDVLKREYFGTYFCVAENGQGKGARREITLEIQFAPVVTVPRERVGQALKYEATLACHIEAFPPPVLTWHKNGEQLSYDDTRYRISNFATEDNTVDTILQFIKTDKRDYGLFTCKAKNNFGEDQGIVEFFESIDPVCPPACYKE